MDISTVSSLKSLAEWALVLSLVVGVAVTVAIVIFGNNLQARANLQIAGLRAEAEASRSRAAEAELEIERLRRQVAARQIDVLALSEELKRSAAATARVTILHPRDDLEAHSLATQIYFGVLASGWEAESPRAITPNDIRVAFPDVGDQLLNEQPSVLAAGGAAGAAGVTVIGQEIEGVPEAYIALREAIMHSVGSVAYHVRPLPSTEDIRVIVGPKPQPILPNKP